MVFFQKTPARVIVELAAELTAEEMFFDIGSGLGQAAILVNLISGPKATGVEFEPAYCDYANACAQRLNLANVYFINADARKADYSKGTVFFLYTHFEGRMLADMLDVLQKEAQKKPITVFTYGPCSAFVARLGWLVCVAGSAGNIAALCGFRNVGGLGL